MKRKEETTFSLSKKEENIGNGATDPKNDVPEEISLSSKSCKDNVNIFTHNLGSMSWGYKCDQYQWSLLWS